MKKALVIGAVALAAVVACGGSVSSPEDAPAKGSSSSSSGGTSGSTSGTSGVVSSSSSGYTSSSSGIVVQVRVPKQHRAVATGCDGVRGDYPSGAPDAGVDPAGYIKCTSHAECTAGKNGRCNGNGHDGWRCTYDACTTDIECGAGNICECEGGFRADNNVCLPTNGCRTDSDCGAPGQGFCSPTLGSCGHYGKTESYECHGPQDECTDDEDCSDGGAPGPFGGAGYCSFDKTIGHWKCSTSECQG